MVPGNGRVGSVGNWVKFCYADLEFHRKLWRSTGNETLAGVLERLVPKLFAFGIIQHARPNPEKLIDISKQHRQLLDLIPKGDRQLYRAASKDALLLSLGMANRRIARLPDLDASKRAPLELWIAKRSKSPVQSRRRGSRCAVISSSRYMSASAAKPRARETRCCSPPERRNG